MQFRCLLAAALAGSPFVHAQTAAEAEPAGGPPLEALLNTEVSSVLKHASGLTDAPAAVTVLRREDIERLGATSLPDLLRVVPGLAVAQLDGNKWAVGARGFNGVFSSMLLVLIDGRSIYNSTFSGVLWDAHDIPLDNIARIEVIRGPGAALWGSNAVNGVINIVTRSAHETVGGRVAATAGNVENHLVDLRFGAAGEAAAWRLYARSRDREGHQLASGGLADDSTRAERVGFRADSTPGASTWMLTGEAYQGRSGGSPYLQPTTNDLRGHHLLGRVTHRLNGASTLQFQVYYDHSWRHDLAVDSVLQEDVFDLDFQQDTALSASHRLTWGGGWRQYRFDSVPSGKLAFVPGTQTSNVSNLFIQDEWTLLPRELLVVAGVRAERLPRQGVEWQPNVRVAWTPTETRTFWAASGRAVRAPSQMNTAVRFCGPVATNLACVVPPGMGNAPPTFGNPSFQPETIVSLEAGWRERITPRLSSDLSLYRNRYRRLETIELAPTFTNLTYNNHGRGKTQGLEWALDWQAAERWQLRAGLTLYRERLAFTEASMPPLSVISFHDSFPNRQAFLRSLWDIGWGHRLDLTLRAVGPLSRLGVSGYGTADFRWAWRADKSVELALTGRNIGGPRHREISDQPFFQETLLRRELFGSVALTF